MNDELKKTAGSCVEFISSFIIHHSSFFL